MIQMKMMMLDILKHETGAKAGNQRHVGPDSHDFQAFLHPVQGFCRGEARNKTWPKHGNRKGWFVTSIPNDPNVFVKLRWTICSAHFDSHSSWILAHECAWLTPRSSMRKSRFKHMFAASWSGSCSPPSQGYEQLRGHHYVRYCMGTTETINQLWLNDSTDYSTLLLVQGIGMISMLYPASSEPCSEKNNTLDQLTG